MEKVYKNYTEEDLIALEYKRGKKRLAIIIPLILLFFAIPLYSKADFYTATAIFSFIIITFFASLLLIIPLRKVVDTPELRQKMCDNAIKYLEKKEKSKNK